AGARRGAFGGRAAAAGPVRRRVSGGVRGDRSGWWSLGGRAAGPAQGPPARVHGALVVRAAGVDTADGQRQARQEGPRGPAARAGRKSRRPGTADADRGAGGGDLRRGPEAGTGGAGGGFLRARRTLPAGDAGDVAPAPGFRRRSATTSAVR